MKTKILLSLLFLSLSLFSARDMIKDPEFKKEGKYWRLQLKDEYRNLKPVYNKGEISFNVSHISEHYYASLITETRIKEGRMYKLSFKFKGNGEGKVYVTQRCHPNIFKGKRFDPQKDKLISLGLVQTFEPKTQWQQATCTFIAKESPQRHLIEALVFMLGTYKGELTIADLSFVEEKESDLKPNERTGHMDIKEVK